MPNQNPYNPSAPRPNPATATTGAEDRNVLFDNPLEEPSTRPSAPTTRTAPRPAAPPLPQATAGRSQSERPGDDVRAQIRTLALQVQHLTEVASRQVTHDQAVEQALQELRQSMHTVLLSTHKRPAATSMTEPVAGLEVKLVLAEAAELRQQSQRDVAILGGWAMLFGGLGLGTLLAVIFGATGPYLTNFWVELAVSVFAFAVALIFSFLLQGARWRVRNGQRAVDDSTIRRTLS